ncbi:Cytochrome CYP6AN4 [Operophtera brumata]|uniref:unspecific monooxygenase n=1 Tax=Operophtera brumata TaxID=104452 RepID=A0A0L7KVA2_OPEBR|nr:Cytochrome CYP6AN4 [Operophtera brumata]
MWKHTSYLYSEPSNVLNKSRRLKHTQHSPPKPPFEKPPFENPPFENPPLEKPVLAKFLYTTFLALPPARSAKVVLQCDTQKYKYPDTVLIGPKIVNQELEDGISSMTRSIRENRNYKPSGRNELMDILLRMENEAQKLEPSDDRGEQINVDFVAAQLFSLLLASRLQPHRSVSHYIRWHSTQKYKSKFRKKFDAVMLKYENKITYEGIGEMSHLDSAWKESIYTIPGTGVTIEPGVRIVLPSQALHMDPEYFEDPHEFRPERFASGAEVTTSHVNPPCNVDVASSTDDTATPVHSDPRTVLVYDTSARSSFVLAQNIEVVLLNAVEFHKASMLFVISLLFVILLYFYLHVTKNYDYWAKRNVKFDKPLPFFGNYLRNVLAKQIMVYVGVELYYKYPNEKMVGYFRGRIPELIIRDPDIIKHILCTDFPHFHSRGGFESSNHDPLMQNLFFMIGGKWSILRQRISAAFSTAKMKAMFPLVLKCSEKIQETAENLVMGENEIDAYDLMARYSMECIGSCGFGVELDAIRADHSDFMKESKLFFNKTKWQTIYLALEELYPEWKALHRAQAITKTMSDTMLDITKKVREERGFQPSGRNDYMDILLDIESKGQITMESPFERNPDNTPKEVTLEMDLNCIAAQVCGFMFAGFESTATLTSFTLHQLAFNPEAQLRIQQEIDQVLSRYGKLSYEALGQMSWLEMALKESLRMLPPAGLVRRVCNRKYTIPGTDVTIDPGVRILVPLQALHMDPQYYKNPREYCPERFAPNAKKPPKYAYLPGPPR